MTGINAYSRDFGKAEASMHINEETHQNDAYKHTTADGISVSWTDIQ